MLIKDVMVQGLKTISPDASMVEAEKILKEFRFRHLPVFDGKKIIGMLSDRDVQRATTVIASHDSSHRHIHHHRKVSEYMSSPVHTMNLNETLDKLVRLMVDKKVSCIVVQDDTSTPVGIVTTEDLLIVLLDLLHTPSLLNRTFKGIMGLFKN